MDQLYIQAKHSIGDIIVRHFRALFSSANSLASDRLPYDMINPNHAWHDSEYFKTLNTVTEINFFASLRTLW